MRNIVPRLFALMGAAGLLVSAPGSVVAQTAAEPVPDISHALAGIPDERTLADGDLRIVNLYATQGRILREMAGAPRRDIVQRLVDEVWRPHPEFWAGYLGDKRAFRAWAADLLDPAHAVHHRMAALIDVELDRRFTEGADWMRRVTGRRPAGTWYLVFGPGWTDMGGLSDIGMVADFTRMEADSAAIASILPHELTHQVQGAATDPDAGTVLHRIVSEGFASYVAFVYGGGSISPARALHYSDAEWRWALEHERELFREVEPMLESRDRADVDRVASRGVSLIQGAPGAAGYFLGLRIVERYVAARGPDSWMELYDLPVRDVLRRSGYVEALTR